MSRIDEVVSKIEAAIGKGVFKSGQKLLSVRVAAVEYNLSKNSMAEVYDRLAAKGLVYSRPGSGYYVSTKSEVVHRTPSSHVMEAVDSISLLREQLERHYTVRVGDGRPPEKWMQRLDIGREIAQLKTSFSKDVGYGYSNPWGFLPLRERIALMLDERSIQVDPAHVLLTQGANHALDLVSRQLLEPGDVALVDTPGYYPLFGKLKLMKVKVIGVKRNADGPDVDDLIEKCKIHRPKVFFTQSLAHNPTGTSISLPVAHKLLQVAEEFGLYVVEDDPFADILPLSSARLATLDQLNRVIYIGTFSKVLSASVRVGYVVAEQKLMETLCNIKMVTVVSTSDILERLVYNIIARGKYLKYLRYLKNMIGEEGAVAIEMLADSGMRFPYGFGGGYYVWGEVSAPLNEFELVKRAAREGIFLAPGSLFRPQPVDSQPAFRVNIAYASDETFLNFIRNCV